MDKRLNVFRLRDTDVFGRAAENKSLQEARTVLLELAATYFKSAPGLFEFSSLFLRKKVREDAEASLPLDEASYAVFIINTNGTIESLDERAEVFFGYSANELLGHHIKILFKIEDDQGLDSRIDILQLSRVSEGRRKNRTSFAVKVRVSSVHLSGSDLFVVIIYSLVESLALTAKQRRAEVKYRTLVEQVPAVVFMVTLEDQSQELYVSPQIEEMLGFSPEEWISDPIRWFHQIHPDDRERMSSEFSQAFIERGAFRGEFRVLTRNQCVLWVHCEIRMVRDDKGAPLFIQGVGFDITETKLAEEKVRASLKEKEVLLKEIHHRVKNNLQITSSLLHLQMSKIKDKEALRIFIESDARIRSIALVHEKLYQSKDLTRIDFCDYIKGLTTYLARAYNLNTSRISLRLDVEEVHLGIAQAVPCALIINELVSNCIKHAFPCDQAGEISISFHHWGNYYKMVIADTGVGVPMGFDFRAAKTLGLQLVVNLTSQLDGTVQLRNQGQGMEFEVIIPKR